MTREETVKNLLTELIDMIDNGSQRDLDRADEISKTIIEALSQEPCEDAQERYEDLCEYFGEAKDILKSRKDFKEWLDRIKWYIRKAEELYEKYEYKQEPCDDAISRDATLKPYEGLNDEDTISVWLIRKNIEQQPSVTQKPIECEDVVSRQAVLCMQYRIDDSATLSTRDVVNVDDIEDLPPVRPQLCDDAISRMLAQEEITKSIELKENPHQLWERIQALPSVTQKPGKWRRVSIDKYTTHAQYWYECDKCGEQTLGEHNYCPNCGANMEVENG